MSILGKTRKDTKLKADIAEHAAITKLLRMGFRVLKPVGDRLPYDLAIDYQGKLIRLQVKSAWKQKDVFTVDTRRTKTNRRNMIRARYEKKDFDFALLYIEVLDIFYVLPFNFFLHFAAVFPWSKELPVKDARVPIPIVKPGI